MKNILFIIIILVICSSLSGEIYLSGLTSGIAKQEVSIILPTDYTLDASVVGVWLLEIDNATQPDATGHNNNATVSGATYTSAEKPAGFTGSYYFDGVNDVITVDNEGNFDADWDDPITIMAWVKAETGSASVQRTIVSKGDGTLNTDLILDNSHGVMSHFVKLWSADASRAEDRVNVSTSNTNVWIHYAMTYNGSKDEAGILFYRNGVETDSTVDYSGLEDDDSILNNAPVRIGSRAASAQPFKGWICHAGWFNRVLAASEIAEVFDSGIDGSK
jgi:hypothetical protein